MYNKIAPTKTLFKVNNSYQGETIEQKIMRITNNREPISDSAPIIYSDRKDGTLPEYDVRTDSTELALEAMDAASRTNAKKRDFSVGERTWDTMSPEQQQAHITKFPKSKFNKQKPGTGVDTSDGSK